ncbi:MAG: hypothetical protein ABIG37_00150 [Nanoarchaeota archaeon]|nr:hypothetical protein [Nanoarchaeota archaeon]
MKKYILIISVVIFIVLFFIIFRFGGEDSWIKNKKGIYIKHGNPSKTPDYVKEQQDAIICAIDLYEKNKEKNITFSSQCLGTCGNFAVDIVHAPKTEKDNLIENQCKEYNEKKVNHFIELDKDSNIIQVV